MQHKKHHHEEHGDRREHREHKEHRDREALFRGRKFSSDEIQLLILHFLSKNPNYGYELIKLFTARSNGFYTPSPGVIYPALTYLEEIGYVSVQAEGSRKQYSLSDSGREYLSQNEKAIAKMLGKFERLADKMNSVREAIDGNPQEKELLAELREAMHKLRHVLHSMKSVDEDTQRRIADLIKKLADEIAEIIKNKEA